MRASLLRVVVRRGVRVIAPLTAGIVVVALIVVATAARRSARLAQATPSEAPRSSAALGSSSPPGSPLAVSSAAPVSSSPTVPEGSTSALLGPPSDNVAKLPVLASHWQDGGVAGFTPANPPQSTMIGGANDLLAVGTTLLGATDQGIALSTDAGATWRYVLTGVDLWSVTRAGSGFAALGRRGGPYENGPGVVATSPDGVTWRLVDPAVPPQPIVPFGYGDRIAATGVDAHAVDIAVPDVVASSAPGDTLRSIDGGRTWVATGMKFDTGIDVLPDGRTMYATGTGNTGSCAGAVYRSADAGAHWTLLPGSCQNRPLYAVTFVDADHGFAAGGTPEKYDGSDVVEATDDGGHTWQTRWSTPFDPNYGGGGGSDNEIVRLAFADAQHGYALTGGCVDGQNGPCGGNLYVTSDAGHSWQPTGRVGLALTATGSDVYLTGVPQRVGPSLAISTDAGQHWTLHSDATQVSSQAVAGSGQVLWWQTNIGTFTSTDAGAHWTPSIAAAIGSLPNYADPLQAAPPGDLLALERPTGTIWSSTDEAATARDSTPGAANDVVQEAALGPGGRAAAIVGFNDDCSSPQLIAKMAQAKPGWRPETRPTTLYVSGDAGAHWERQTSLPFPFSSFSPGSLAISSSLLVAIDACANLELSSDDGRDWATTAPAHAGSGCMVSLDDTEIWLDCPASIAHSADAGVTWTSYTTNPGGVQQLSQPLEAIGPKTAIVSAAGSLWRTTDGGTHWTQTWPALAGES